MYGHRERLPMSLLPDGLERLKYEEVVAALSEPSGASAEHTRTLRQD